jgi:hypothetical protein
MATASPTTLPITAVETQFTDVITITFDDVANGNLISVSTSLESPGVTISNTVDTVTITGKYSIDIFDNKSIKHITRGSSNLLEQFKTSLNFNELDSTRQVYDYSADPRNSIVITYTIDTTEGMLQVTKTIQNEYSSGRDALREFV